MRPSRFCLRSPWGLILITFTAVGLLPGATPAAQDFAPIALARKLESQPPDERGTAFEIDGKNWGDVFRWLSDKTGLPFCTSFNPNGAFTYTGPKGAKHSIPEMTEIITQSLLLQNGLLLLQDGERFILILID